MDESRAALFRFERHVYLAAIEEKLRYLLFLGKLPDELESWREGGCECTRVGDETFRWCVDRERGVMRLERDADVPEWWERREKSAPQSGYGGEGGNV